MKIVVLVKEVPDTYGDRKLDLETGLADRAASETVLDEIGERSLEVALTYADKNPGHRGRRLVDGAGGLGGDGAQGPRDGRRTRRCTSPMRRSLGADLGLTAEVLAAAIRAHRLRPGDHGQPLDRRHGWRDAAMVAELLGVPQRPR